MSKARLDVRPAALIAALALGGFASGAFASNGQGPAPWSTVASRSFVDAPVAIRPIGPSSDATHGPRRNAANDGLTEPGNWLLMVIGVAMIGGALRGFVVANRRLARLQPGQLD